MITALCENCGYWQQKKDDSKIGKCHFSAPIPHFETDKCIQYVVVWPETDHNDFCASWAPCDIEDDEINLPHLKVIGPKDEK